MRGCLCTLFETKSRTSQMARPNPLDLTVCPKSDVMEFPLTIVPKLRTCVGHTKRFEDRGCPVLEPLRMRYTLQRAQCALKRLSKFFIQGPVSVSLTIGTQNAIESCRWSSDFYMYLSAVVIITRLQLQYPARTTGISTSRTHKVDPAETRTPDQSTFRNKYEPGSNKKG
jgi:hypothetical protein